MIKENFVFALSSLYLSTKQKAYEKAFNLSTKIRSTAPTHTNDENECIRLEILLFVFIV